jgi:phospholipid transport system substrate-binding protein
MKLAMITFRSARRWMLAVLCLAVLPAWAEDAPDQFIKNLTTDLLDTVKNDSALKSGDTQRLGQLVDQKIMPSLNFQRMTASAVGPAWRQASPEQRARLQQEFKALLIRTYSGAVSQVKQQTVAIKPMRGDAGANEVLVRTEVRGGAEPVDIDYRLEKSTDAPSGWRIYNMNVAGIWLVDTYRTQFAQEINAKGIDGLIASLSERNQSGARK